MTVVNPPNQSNLAFRIGTYATFLDSMLARLAEQGVPATDGGDTVYPLARLTTRDSSDLVIALLNAWAVVGDIATFYQERIANEGFLGTALQTRSMVLLTGDIGYQFQPAVAASASLAFTINPQATALPVSVPAGTQVLSAPASGQPAEVFETVEALQARADWNALHPLQTTTQVLDATSLSVEVQGNLGQFTVGQPLAFYDGDAPVDFRLIQNVTPGSSANAVRLSWTAALSHPYERPAIVTFEQQANIFGFNAPVWHDLPDAVRAQYGDALPSAIACMAMAPDGQHVVTGQTDGSLILWSVAYTASSSAPLSAGRPVAAHTSVNSVTFSPDGSRIASAGSDGIIRLWDAQLNPLQVLRGGGGSINSLAFSPQFASDHRLVSGGADQAVLVWRTDQGTHEDFTGHLSAVTSVAYSPDGGFVLSGSQDRTVRLWKTDRTESHVYEGHTAAVTCVAFLPNFSPTSTSVAFVSGSADYTILWWTIAGTSPTTVYRAHTAAVTSLAFSPSFASDHMLLSTSLDQSAIVWTSPADQRRLRQHFMAVTQAVFCPPANSPSVNWAISVSADTTAIVWNLAGAQPIQIASQLHRDDEWPGYQVAPDQIDLASFSPAVQKGGRVALWTGNGTTSVVTGIDSVSTETRTQYMLTARVTSIGLASAIDPASFPRRETLVGVQDRTLLLSSVPLVEPIEGSTLVLDQPVLGLHVGQSIVLSGNSSSGRPFAEVLKLRSVEHDAFDRPTVLRFEQPLEREYARSSVTLNANVAVATHGETVANEVLGSGDGRREHQQFTLGRAPLTYVSNASLAGIRSTLTIYVNGVQWQEVRGTYGASAQAQVYTVRVSPNGTATVHFGDGVQGARLPSGTENVLATYRVGAGLTGEVAPGTLTQLKSSNPSILAVTNPLRASGAANADSLTTARQRAPRTVSTLGRIVSLRDFQDFVQSFPGVGCARTSVLWNGRAQVVHITVVGADQHEIPADSLLYRGLAEAIDAIRDPAQPVIIQSGTDLICPFDVRASIVLAAGYPVDRVLAAAHSTLANTFAFERSSFGVGVALSTVTAVLQGVPGVHAANVQALYLDGKPPALEAFLSVDLAHWDVARAAFVPDQLLMINAPEGIHLSVELGPGP